MPTPCVKICVMDGNRCIGCNRTKQHIAEWASYTPKKQLKIMKELRDEQYKTKQ
jgi:predicted Fe-S protein YdhL (DUF1289 family)